MPRTHARIEPHAPAWAAIVAAIWLSACGQDDAVVKAAADVATDASADGRGIGRDDAASGTTPISATPTGAASGPRVELVPTVLEDGTIEVKVALRDIADLFGVAGHLRYDATRLELVTSKAHAVLAGEGWEPRSLLHLRPGRLLLGGARVRVGGSPYSPLQGVKVGNQLWATLTFRKIAPGDAVLSFDPAHLLARAANYSLLKLEWQGLTIQGGGGQ